MTITQNTSTTSVPDAMPSTQSTPTTSVTDVMSSINTTLKSAGPVYASYSCKTVSWDDVTRGTVGGELSSLGSNITDTRLYEKTGEQLYTVRSDNFNEKLGRVSADEVALISGNQQAGGGPLTPITLRDFLQGMGTYGSYAGLDKSTNLADSAADQEVSIRFMTTFLPVADSERATLEFAPEMYQYQTRSESDPANLLLLATTQGVAVQANGSGATRLFHHAVEPGGQIARYWFEAERSSKKVGGAQLETKEEALEAASRGKATASVIGTRSMGTRFNVLMTIQVPLKQRPPPQRRSVMDFGMPKMKGKAASLSLQAKLFTKSAPQFAVAADLVSDEDYEDASDEDWDMPMNCAPMEAFGSASIGNEAITRSFSLRRRGCPPPPRVGRANAARVSRGSMVDRVGKTVHVAAPTRDAAQHVTVTVVIYNTVAGGVPSVEDVRAAIDDMEQLYASCGWKGELASDGAAFMKKELTVKDVSDIGEKLATQPYLPPAGAVGLVVGGDVFPTSSGAA